MQTQFFQASEQKDKEGSEARTIEKETNPFKKDLRFVVGGDSLFREQATKAYMAELRSQGNLA